MARPEDYFKPGFAAGYAEGKALAKLEERRERIATAAMQGLLVSVDFADEGSHPRAIAGLACEYAHALLLTLDAKAKAVADG